MGKPTGLTALYAVGVLSYVTLVSTLLSGPAVSVPRDSERESEQKTARIPFTQRYHSVQHGGIVRAANSAITCQTASHPAAASCAKVQRGAQGGVNGDFDMLYIDVDDDPNTYNSSRAELALPAHSRVSYARLYWGGNLRVGEQKPPRDNGRVLFAEPGGEYKAVLADTPVAHRTADGSDAFQASADVTRLVRQSGAGQYTVAQINVAKGQSAVGAWGGWTLVVAYENEQQPLRNLAIWDGFETLGAARRTQSLKLAGLDIPAGATGRAGVVSYDGDRSMKGDTLRVTAGRFGSVSLRNSANPANNLMNSTITDFGRSAFKRQPHYVNTLGYDSDVFDLKPALSHGGDSLNFHFSAGSGEYFLGALFVQADSRR
ncbi:DUF3344 domain-containing protein [Streptomyces sp. PSKA54]|uniref:DUF3344 domain-containing protein n=1 Tax=Streptomyces himalayensis subsp. aureolus TaxID=2758039 RepID=A0A7W2D017_9ACTN|nr:DUF3344 domain-containing protein [Streptomyces himalayensis]MBA4862209.1 DUF3344 domain-containing protein [Streptomyces himalayensis subsp. aureolus]